MSILVDLCDTFAETNIISIGLFGILYYLLLPRESIPFWYVSPNGHDLGCCDTIKNYWSCTRRNEISLLECIQCVIDHALKFLLYHCTIRFVSLAMNIVSSIAAVPGGFRFGFNLRFCCN